MEKVAQMLYRLADDLEIGKDPTEVQYDATTAPVDATAETIAEPAVTEPGIPVEPVVSAPSFVCQRCGHEETLEDMNAANKAAAGETPIEDIAVEDSIQCPQCEGGVMMATFDDGSDDEPSEESAEHDSAPDSTPTEPPHTDTEVAPEMPKVAALDAQKAALAYEKLKNLSDGARAALSKAFKWTGKTLGEMAEVWSEILANPSQYPFHMLEKFYDIRNSAELKDAMMALRGLKGPSLKQEWRDEILKALHEAILKFSTGEEQVALVAELGSVSQNMQSGAINKLAAEQGGPDEMMLVLFGLGTGMLAPDQQYTPEALSAVHQEFLKEHGNLLRTAADAAAAEDQPVTLNIDVKSNLNKIYEQGAPIINKYLSYSKNEDNNAAIAKFMSVIGVDRAKVTTLVKELSTVAPPKNVPGQKTPVEFLKDKVSLTDIVLEQTLLVVFLEFLLVKGTYRPEDLADVDKAYTDLRASMETYMGQLFPAYDTLGLLPLAAADIFAKPGATVAKQASSTAGLDLDKVARYL